MFVKYFYILFSLALHAAVIAGVSMGISTSLKHKDLTSKKLIIQTVKITKRMNQNNSLPHKETQTLPKIVKQPKKIITAIKSASRIHRLPKPVRIKNPIIRKSQKVVVDFTDKKMDTLDFTKQGSHTPFNKIECAKTHVKQKKRKLHGSKKSNHGSLPVPIFVPKLSYSETARNLRIEGAVILLVTINKLGKSEKVIVLKSLGYGLDKIAIKALKQARFKPGTDKNGRVKQYKIRYQYEFSLEEEF